LVIVITLWRRVLVLGRKSSGSYLEIREYGSRDPSRGPVRFRALPDFLRSSGSGTGSTQLREYKWGATCKKKVAAHFIQWPFPSNGPTCHSIFDNFHMLKWYCTHLL
jgi:hypothetical protein